MKVHTESVKFKADKKLLQFIDQKVGKLDQFFDRIVDADVILRLENSGQVKDKVAEIRLNVPGQQLFAKQQHKSFEESIDKAVDDLRRQLTKYKEKLRPNNHQV